MADPMESFNASSPWHSVPSDIKLPPNAASDADRFCIARQVSHCGMQSMRALQGAARCCQRQSGAQSALWCTLLQRIAEDANEAPPTTVAAACSSDHTPLCVDES